MSESLADLLQVVRETLHAPFGVQDGAKPMVVQDRSRTIRAVLRAVAGVGPCDCDIGFQCSACALRADLREVITMLEDD